MENAQTGFVLLRVNYDAQKYDLEQITHKMQGGQGFVNLQVIETVTPENVTNPNPFIAF